MRIKYVQIKLFPIKYIKNENISLYKNKINLYLFLESKNFNKLLQVQLHSLCYYCALVLVFLVTSEHLFLLSWYT